jgi:hypothetical protein
MIRRSAALALLVALALPAAALADPPWSPTQDLSTPHLFVDPVDVIASGDGTALAWWRWQNGTASNAPPSASVASRPPGGAFGPERPAPSGIQDIEAYAQTRAIALTAGAPRLTAPTRLAVAFGSTGGAFGSQRRIVDERSLGGIPKLAVNVRGDAAIAYYRNLGGTNNRVMVSLRRAGGSFGAPFQVAHGRIRSVAVAVGPRGDVLVAWDARGTIQARYRSPSVSGFQPIETISSDPTFFAQIQAAVTNGGRCYLAWSAKFLSEGGSQGPVFDEVAVRPAGHRFRAAQRLERDGESFAQRPVALALTGDRDATVAWTGFDGTNARVRVAATDPSARFGAPQDVSPAGRDGVVSDLAAAAGPVSWCGTTAASTPIRCSRRWPGRGRPSAPPRRSPRPRRRAAAAPSSSACRRSCGPTARPGRTRRAAWPPCRPSPRRRRARPERVERRSSHVYTGQGRPGSPG